jgi:hypothetical protein
LFLDESGHDHKQMPYEDEPIREGIRFEFFDWLHALQYHGGSYRDGNVFESWGIFFVFNPCAAGRA